MLLKMKSTLFAFQGLTNPEKGAGGDVQTVTATQAAFVGPEEEPVPRSDADRLAREDVLKLIQNVFLQPGSARRQVVLFAEVERHPGGAVICGGTAEVLAQGAGSVCLVDADFGAPSLHQRFYARVTHGLLDVLQNGGSACSVAQQVGINLWLLPCGSGQANSHTLLSPDRFRLLFKDLRDEFDYVVVKGQPFTQCADSVFLSQLSDGVVLLIEAHRTHRERARIVKESLAAAQVPLLGVVLTNRTFPIPDALYRRL